MEIIDIFTSKHTKKGLHSIKFDDEELCEFDRLFEQWGSAQYVRKYLKQNLSYLQSGFYGDITLEQAITEVMQEVFDIRMKLYQLSKGKKSEIGNRLEEIFQPLSVADARDQELRREKLKLKGKSKVRIYAIRVTPDIYIVTGGAIKLVESMQDHDDTTEELRKINRVKNWLRNENIIIQDDLIYYYEGE